VNYYHPPEKFSSISFSRAIDLGFGKYVELDQIISPQIGSRLLLAPFYAMDGMNEHGLVVAVTGLKQTTVHPVQGKESIFIIYLMHNILDHTKTVEEAIAQADKVVPFDLDINSLNGHFFVADS
jgi:penicillin V acylase-like amidase (Ntn superfamily)